VSPLTLILPICLTKGVDGVVECALRESTTTWLGGVLGFAPVGGGQRAILPGIVSLSLLVSAEDSEPLLF
jgi:hypothetical protein